MSFYKLTYQGNQSCEGRIIAIDYGEKRCGIAISDPSCLIAGPLKTLETPQICNFLEYFIKNNEVCLVIIGYSCHKDGTPMPHEKKITKLVKWINHNYPEISVGRLDERFTSKMASWYIHAGGAKKKDKKNKNLIDTISAVIMLQEYLDNYKNKY